ncbi:hypothetical protein M408DRAFT_30930 [Serendipita vermifera MAFF 305830]|uniref:CHAT domain-containing protein n=1 Tax=Serendipita vermifera MAFF 305830 TaxID=933852 RepID=A0A0C3AKG3_SERVB|nr:hypothetical protein M408DRAFT_30930 [Serendipita vermifera MAFF 305830]
MLQLTNICVESPIPLHTYLQDGASISVRLSGEGVVYAETPFVSGNLKLGRWTINTSLSIPEGEQLFTLGVVTQRKGREREFKLATLKSSELLVQAKLQPDAQHVYRTGNYSIEFTLACSIKSLVPTAGSALSADINLTNDGGTDIESKEPESDLGRTTSALHSSEDVKSPYAKIMKLPDQDSQARELSLLGLKYHQAYQETQEEADIDKAISIHDEAVKLTRLHTSQLAEHAWRLGGALEDRFDLNGDLNDFDRAIESYQSACTIASDSKAKNLMWLDHLADCFESRFQDSGNINDLKQANLLKQEAVGLIPNNDLEKLDRLNRLGVLFLGYYGRYGDFTYMDDGISNLQEAVKLIPDGHPSKSSVLSNLGAALLQRYQFMGNLDDVEEGVSILRKSVDILEEDDPEKPACLSNYATALQTRFEYLHSPADIQNAISIQRRAVELTQDEVYEKPSFLTNLGNMLQMRFHTQNTLADLEDGISCLQEAIELVPESHLQKPEMLSSLSAAFRNRFERLDDIADLKEAILRQREAVALIPDGNPNKVSLLSNLGSALMVSFELNDNLADMEEGVATIRKAVELVSDGHQNKPVLLNNLGKALSSRFQRLGNIKDIEDAISTQHRVIELTPKAHPSIPSYLSDLGIGLQRRFKRLGNINDIDESISNLRKAVELAPSRHPTTAIYLSNLGLSLQIRFERLGQRVDIEDAVSFHLVAVDITPAGHPKRLSWLTHLGVVLNLRFTHFGDLADIQNAISNLQTAADLTPDSHTDKPARLNNLAIALKSRFQCLGNLEDVEQAMLSLRKAGDIMPDGHPAKPYTLSNLGNAYTTRFERLGSVADIESAVLIRRKVVELTPDDHPDKPFHLGSLGDVLHIQFERFNKSADINEGISYLYQAVDLVPDDHSAKQVLLTNLGNALRIRFERFGTRTDIDSAVSSLRKAVVLTPDSHPDRPSRLNNLGTALISHFERLDNLDDVDSAITSLREAATLLPEGHPNKPYILTNLVRALEDRFKRSGKSSDIEEARLAGSQAANSQTGPSLARFRAALSWARISENYSPSQSPIPGFRCALSLLPRIAWLGLPVSDQHEWLSRIGDVVREAVAAAIRLGEYETAVEWAEQGRSIVWQNLLGLRTPLDDLRTTSPELADQLHDISMQLELPPAREDTPEMTHIISTEYVTQRYSQLAMQWDETIRKVREIPGFETFLQAKSLSDLVPAACEGPIVILNEHSSRCDALILSPRDMEDRRISVVNVPLASLTSNMCQRLSRDLKGLLISGGVRGDASRKSARVGGRVSNNDKFKDILGELWLCVVKPVIDALEYQAVPDTRTRAWWCPTGSLSFLPVHAAGLYNDSDNGEKASDYIISSYIPTLATLLDHPQPVPQNNFRILTVAQPSTPYAEPIPNTEDEVARIGRLFSNFSLKGLSKEEATLSNVLQGMRESNWIHLACHGQQRLDEPMKSGLLLHDKILELSEIVKQSLPKAEFAFLSACQTAMGDEQLSEESVHLAAGMVLAGYRSVIATMWSIRDEDAPQVSEDIYSQLLKEGVPNRKKAAYALHQAMRRLRGSGATFLSWVPFIHIGR